MVVTCINRFYSILTHGLSKYRPCDLITTGLSSEIEYLRDILIPPTYTDEQKAILAEMYIKFIKTDSGFNQRLQKIDPYNSYDVTEYNIVTSESIDLAKISQNIKDTGISKMRYNDMIGYIIDGLEHLLTLCEN